MNVTEVYVDELNALLEEASKTIFLMGFTGGASVPLRGFDGERLEYGRFDGAWLLCVRSIQGELRPLSERSISVRVAASQCLDDLVDALNAAEEERRLSVQDAIRHTKTFLKRNAR